MIITVTFPVLLELTNAVTTIYIWLWAKLLVQWIVCVGLYPWYWSHCPSLLRKRIVNCSKVVCIWCTFDGVLDPRDPDSVKTHYPIVPNMHAQMYKSQSPPSLPPLPKTSSGLLMKSKMKIAVVGGQVACNCATVLLIIN